MDIGIVITLLVFLLSIAGPVIEKQLKKAGKVEQARTLRKITDAVSGDGCEDKAEASSSDATDVSEVPAVSSEPLAATASAPVGRSAMSSGRSPETDARAEVLALALEKYRERKNGRELRPQEQTAEKRKLDIDPRKLVIYSEIMKPRF